MSTTAPIILFVYNRPEHTRKTIESLQRNVNANNAELFIYSDGAKTEDTEKVQQVRNYIHSVKGFKNVNIIERKENTGLAVSVISGVTEVINEYKQAIVLEDDMLCSRNFLLYMNNALEMFAETKNIFSISGYTYPLTFPAYYEDNIYLAPRASSWGWATWKDRWDKVDWEISDFNDFIKDKSAVKKFNSGGEDLTRMLKNQMNGKIDSWAIRWSYAHFKNNAYCVFPVKSKIQNIGMDSSGVHSVTTDKFYVDLDLSNTEEILNANIQPDKNILESFRKFHQRKLWDRIYWRIKRGFKIRN